MKNTVICLLLLLFVSGNLLAQKRIIEVSGQIVELDTREPLEAATVQLLSLPDSMQASGVVSDRQGRFVLPRVKAGNYLLKVSYVGYSTLIKPLRLSEKNTSIKLGTLKMEADGVLLDEAVVTAEAPPVVVNADTTEYNASAFRTSAGAMLEELIKLLPGAEIDEDGKITLNGEEIKKIMVNGKEFFGNDTDMSLKNLPADAVKKLKAYREKSDRERLTGIKDGNETPVLDVTLKKNSGWMGQVSGGYGTKDRYAAHANINHFTNDINLSLVGGANNTGNGKGEGQQTTQNTGITYARKNNKLDLRGNVRYRHTSRETDRVTATETFLGDESTFADRQAKSWNSNHSVGGDARVEWNKDDWNTLNASAKFSYAEGNSRSRNWSRSRDNDLKDINETTSASHADNNSYSVESSVGFYHRFQKPGRNLHVELNLDYSKNGRNSYSDSYSTFFKQDSISDIERYTRGDGHNVNWSVSAGYVEPLSEHYRLSLNYTYRGRNGLSQSLVYDSINYEDRVNLDYNDRLSSKVENFHGNQQIRMSLQGDYIDWENGRKGLKYNVGVSLNPRSTENHTTVGPNAFKDLPRQNVLNWSPSLSLDYYFSRRQQFRFNYKGQSSTPSLEDLQEVIDVTDPMNLRYGNPNLKSSFSNDASASYDHYVESTMRHYKAGLSFSNTLNSVANRMTYDKQTGARTYHKVNINGNWSSSANFSFDTPLKNKKFNISMGVHANYSEQASYTVVNQRGSDAELSTTKNFSTNERLRGSYRSDWFDLALSASFRYNSVYNDKQKNSNRETFDYNIGGNMIVRLPWDVELSSDARWRIRNGYSGNSSRDELMWNAQVSKRFLKRKQAMVRFNIYDILKQQSNQSRSVSGTSITDVTTNVLTSYCMFHFSYRFNSMVGKGGRGGMRGEGDRMGRRGGEGYGSRERGGGMSRMRPSDSDF